MLNLCVVALFLAVSFAGCLENDEEEIISPNDVVVNPITLVAGEFQPLVISAKRDVSVFIPHMVVDPASNYLQNGTILDMRTGETKQLTILAPPRIDTAFIFLSKYIIMNIVFTLYRWEPETIFDLLPESLQV